MKSKYCQNKSNESTVQTFQIKGRLTGLNDYIQAERSNRFKAAKIKKDDQFIVSLAINRLEPQKCPCALNIRWVEKDMRRDADNISFALKFIQDALVKRGIIPDDSRKYINEIHHTYAVDKENPRIEVEMRYNGGH